MAIRSSGPEPDAALFLTSLSWVLLCLSPGYSAEAAKPALVSRVELHPAKDGWGFPTDFEIAVSNEGEPWRTVLAKTNYHQVAGIKWRFLAGEMDCSREDGPAEEGPGRLYAQGGAASG